ncbi:transposase [Mesotoga sp.]|uniref:transposase n=1 Tax=Mesotoga sp. TaxID=2053577 RepID=UPI003563347A
MPRHARVVFEGVAHHITQRGNYRQNIFEDDSDRKRYLQLVGEYSEKYKTKIFAYCLMTNHVHFIAAPMTPDSLALTFKYANMRYSKYFNFKNKRSGHLWQARFYSCPLFGNHAIEAVRYVERNPVRANLVGIPWEYEWSSAAEHVGLSVLQSSSSGPNCGLVHSRLENGSKNQNLKNGVVQDTRRKISRASDSSNNSDLSKQETISTEQDIRKASVDSNSEIAKHTGYGITLSSLEELGLNWNSEGWKEFLGYPDDESFIKEMRSSTISGKPFFSEGFELELGENTAASTARKKRGRPRKAPRN